MSRRESSMVGQVLLGRYRVVRPLGQGGMGVVYLGRVEGAAGFAKPVVIKTISPHLTSDENMEKLFVREARILSNLQHPNIVGVIDFGQADDNYVMVLEYVHGYHLGQWAKYLRMLKRPMSIDSAIYVVTRVLDALAYAHTLTRSDGTLLGIVHRDVSPANILMDAWGHVKLYDFGIARMAEDAGEYRTQDGTFKGTISFTAPEVLQGTAATPLSDLYACGVILYQMLAAENPFTGKELRETLHRVLTFTPVSISSRRKDVPPELDAILEKALAKSREQRFPSATAFADALRSLRSRTEEEAFAAFANEVQADFRELPTKLKLESLDVRDAAWREAQDGPEEKRPSLSMAVASAARDSGFPKESLPPTIHTSSPLVEPTGQTKTEPHTFREVTAPATPTTALSPATRFLWLGLSLTLAVAVALAIVIALRPSSGDTGPDRVLVIEKQETPTPAAAVAPVPHATETSEPTKASASAQPPQLTTKAPSSISVPPKSAGGPTPASLSATFARQQPRVEACFERHAREVEGRPQIAVRFSVDEAGSVKKAEVIPALLASSPLGTCVLGIARGTRFGDVGKPLSFTIPITARRVTQ